MKSTSCLSLFSLTGKRALVTGGFTGIGQAISTALAETGADIELVQRDGQNTSAKYKIEALGRECKIFVADLTSTDHKSPIEDWNLVLQFNLNTAFMLCRDVGAHMLSRPADETGHRGYIINIASLLKFQDGITVPAYAASKGGIAQLTKALSNEWTRQGINVNADAPGYIATAMNTALIDDEERAASILSRIPKGRWGVPDDFKGPAVFLASRASAYVSGEILTVDGGWMDR